MSGPVTEWGGPLRWIRYRFINEHQAGTAVAISYRAVSICKAERTRKSWGEGKKTKKRRGERRKKKSPKIETGTKKKGVFLSQLRYCFEKVLPLGPECQLAFINSLCQRQAMWSSMPMNSSTPLLTCVFIRPPTLEIKFTWHFMFLLFMSSTAVHFMGFCLPLQAPFDNPAITLALSPPFVALCAKGFDIHPLRPPPVAANR